jgi:oligopeptide transport system ATP-binding protein
MSVLLQVRGLTKTYPASGGPPWRRRRFTALSDVSIDVDRGRTLGLVGESGSGKSTLGRCVLGLAATDGGSVVFDGQDVSRLRGAALAAFRRRVQPVFQDPYSSLDPRWSIGRSVRESLDVYKVGNSHDRAQRVRDLFDRVGLNPALADRLPSSLSGGQRQRVGIAAALASEPELIVADEPVSALDVSVQAQILNLFLDLQSDLGVATIFVTHDLGVVEHVSDDIAVLFHGRVVERGPADQVLRSPQDPYTQRLLAAVPRPPVAGSGTRIPGTAPL